MIHCCSPINTQGALSNLSFSLYEFCCSQPFSFPVLLSRTYGQSGFPQTPPFSQNLPRISLEFCQSPHPTFPVSHNRFCQINSADVPPAGLLDVTCEFPEAELVVHSKAPQTAHRPPDESGDICGKLHGLLMTDCTKLKIFNLHRNHFGFSSVSA